MMGVSLRAVILLMLAAAASSAVSCPNGVCSQGMEGGPCWFPEITGAFKYNPKFAGTKAWAMIHVGKRPVPAGACRADDGTAYGLFDGKNFTCPEPADFVCCATADARKCPMLGSAKAETLGPLLIGL